MSYPLAQPMFCRGCVLRDFCDIDVMMSYSFGQPHFCDGWCACDFCDIDFHFPIQSFKFEFAAAVFYNESCMSTLNFFTMSYPLGQRHFGHGWCAWDFWKLPFNPYGVLGGSTLNGFAFWRGCAFVTCKSHAVGEGRPSKTGGFLTSMCLKCRTLVS